MNDAYEKLRSPMPQLLGSLTLIPLAFSSAQYFYGLTLSMTPWHLKISWLFMFLVSISTFLIYTFRRPKDHENMKRKALVLLIINILAMYSCIFAMYHSYFFLATRKGIDLFGFWIVGTITMFLCILSFISGVVLLHKTPSWLKGKTHKDKVGSKIIVIIILFAIGLVAIIEKMIEYIIIPNINESKFIILLIVILLLFSYFSVFPMYIYYTQVLSNYELEDADEPFY